MTHVISFRTTKFDVSKETLNPINPIAGQSVLSWLREQLAKDDYRSTEPDTEDWGWYIDVEGHGASYLVGASAEADSSTDTVDCTLQVHRTRSVTDRLFGRNKMAVDDPLSALIERILRGDTAIVNVSVDRKA